jgi:hypothetical protein
MCDDEESGADREIMRRELAKLEEEIVHLKKERRRKREEIWNVGSKTFFSSHVLMLIFCFQISC